MLIGVSMLSHQLVTIANPDLPNPFLLSTRFSTAKKEFRASRNTK